MAGNCTVAMVDRRELPLKDWPSLLSAREWAEAASYRNPVRRERTIASRVLAKYMVTHPEACGFLRLGAGDFEPDGSGGWNLIELLSGTAAARSRGVIFQDGKSCSELSFSSSHCGWFTAAGANGAAVGLDLERIEPRRPEFYSHMFSAAERKWAEELQPRNEGLRETAFSLLWSAKEAFLKLSGVRDFSIWSFPGWTVWFDGVVEGFLRTDLQDEFLRVSGGIYSREFSHDLQIGIMRTGGMILTTVQYQELSGK